MSDASRIGAAVIGTGFIGTVHLQALRRLGVRIEGVLGSSAARGRERAAALGVARAYGSLRGAAGDPRVEVVHVTSPNNLHYEQVKRPARGRQARRLREAAGHDVGRVDGDDGAGREQRARGGGVLQHALLPLNQQARGMVEAGELGEPRLVTGRFHQDWLARETDWNWRLTPEAGGALRAVGDIGTHWVDLTSFIVGMRPSAVFADLSTFIPERLRPVGPVETFAKSGGATEAVRIATEDAALILLRYPNGARGSLTVSQVSPGRKNTLDWDVSGSAASAAWHSETPDHLWIGHRDGPNGIMQRDPGQMNALGAAAASLPGGHVEGFADSFHALFRQVYADVAAGGRQAGSTYAGFKDGHFEMLFCEAVLESAQQGRWVEIPGA
jgi:predicted dehydrogenase